MATQEAGRTDVRVSEPKRWAAGVPGVVVGLRHALGRMGVRRSLRTLRAVNQKHGFDCPGCAWPEGERRKLAEFCENGAKAVAYEADTRRLDAAFFARESLSALERRGDFWLGRQGRLVEPMHRPAGADHYQPISWDAAFDLIARELAALDSPDQAAFYTSGRTSNEAAFLYQLLARAFGTNNLPDCSNMCHESSGSALTETLGVGKGSVLLSDLAKADLIFVVGQNPGTNHPRMLTALEEAKRAGAHIVAVNPLPEAGLLRFKNPQRPSGLVGAGTTLADDFLQIRLNGDMALFQALGALLLAAEEAAPGSVLDREFIAEHTAGFDAYAAHLRALDWNAVREATGLERAAIEAVAERVRRSERIIVCWAMGLTQHRNSVATIKEVVNFLLLRGNVGRPGAGVCPVRGHSNVQGDRTMGIWERPKPQFLDALRDEFAFEPPRHHGYDVVESVKAMRDGRVRVLIALGGNFVAAAPDTAATEAAVRRCALTVQVSTKLNRSHVITGEQALILPCLGRTEIDERDGVERFVTVEDSMGMVHATRGTLAPADARLRSEVEIVSGLAARVVGSRTRADWPALAADYDLIRAHIANVVPGFEDFNVRARRPGGFTLPHGPRDARSFPTATGKANFTVNTLRVLRTPAGRLLLQTIRSHDQYNTTVYGLDDRYRGVHGGRHVVFVNPDDLSLLGVADGSFVDLVSEGEDGVERRARSFRVVGYPTAAGCAAAYFPETNVLVPLDSTAEVSNTPTSKSIVVRLEPTAARTDASRPRSAARDSVG